jgi:hypothetical protein
VLKPKVFQAADIDTYCNKYCVFPVKSRPFDLPFCLLKKKLLRMSHLYYVGTFRMAIVGHNQR